MAAAQPRPSLTGRNMFSATASVLSYLGHNEDRVVKETAESFAAALDTNVVVTAGINRAPYHLMGMEPWWLASGK